MQWLAELEQNDPIVFWFILVWCAAMLVIIWHLLMGWCDYWLTDHRRK